MPTKKAPPEVNQAPAEERKSKRHAAQAAAPAEPVPTQEAQEPAAAAAPPERTGMSGEGASSALAHLIEQQKARTDTAGGG